MHADNQMNALSGHLGFQLAFFVGGGGTVPGAALGGPAFRLWWRPGKRQGKQQTHSRMLPVHGWQRRGPMEFEAVVRQLMERSFEASVRGDTWTFANHALVETLIALALGRPQSQHAEFHFPDSLEPEQRE